MIVRYILFLYLLLFSAFAYGGNGTQNDPYKIYMILWRGETSVERGFLDYFKQRGIAVQAIVRNFDRDRTKAASFIAEARTIKPDLIYTWGTGGTLAIRGRHDVLSGDNRQQFLTEFPGVFTLVAYPKRAGIIADFDKTGRNLTGVSFLAPVEAQIGAINAYLAPDSRLKNLGMIYNPLEKNASINKDVVKRYAEDNNITLHIEAMPIITVTEEGRTYDKPDTTTIPKIVQKLHSKGVEFLYVGADSYLTRKVDVLSEAAMKHGLPIFAATEAAIRSSKSKILLSLTTVYYNLGQLTAYQAEQILKNGKSPQEIPVRSLSKFHILLNRKAMQELKYFPPIDLLLDAQFIDNKDDS